jgi:hypothetical protein
VRRNDSGEPPALPSVEVFFDRCATGQMILPHHARQSPLPLKQFLCLYKFSFLQIRNNVIVYSAFFTVVLIVSIILAAIYSSQTGQSGMQNRIGIIFFLVSSVFLHNILFVDNRKKEYLSFLRHRAHGYFGALTYLMFFVTSSACVRLFTSSVFTVVVYSLGNIGGQWDYTNLRDLVAIVALTSFSTSLVVFLVCAVVPTARMAHFVLFSIYTFNVILAGIILNINTLPKPFQVLSLASQIRLGYESAVVTQFEGQNFGCTTQISSNETVSCYTGDQYMRFLGFTESRKWKNVEILLIISAVTVVLCYGVMLFYKPPRRLV